jgi:hypothetical protein
MSAEARKECPEPTALEEGGRNEDVVFASGVLLRFPILWFPDMLSIIELRVLIKREKGPFQLK